jgi:hypothetical protein
MCLVLGMLIRGSGVQTHWPCGTVEQCEKKMPSVDIVVTISDEIGAGQGKTDSGGCWAILTSSSRLCAGQTPRVATT